MKKIFLIFACLVLAGMCSANVVYDDTYYRNHLSQFGSDSTFDPMRKFLGELEGDGTASNRGFSPAIWDNCPVYKLEHDPASGFVYFADFKEGAIVPLNSATDVNSLLPPGMSACTAATAGTTISTLATDCNGIAQLNCTTDNEDVILSALGGHNTAGMCLFQSGKKLWMECRIARTSIDDNDMDLFVGFAEEGLVATTTFWSTSDALADKDYVGFTSDIDRTTDLDGSVFDTIYNTASGSGVPANAGTGEVTFVAATWTKLGIYFDGTTVYFYQDGAKLASSVAYSATGFPDGEEMAFYIAMMLSSGDTAAVQVDWIRIAQEI